MLPKITTNPTSFIRYYLVLKLDFPAIIANFRTVKQFVWKHANPLSLTVQNGNISV